MVQNYRKGKNFQKIEIFSINSKKFKNYISLEIFTQLSLELQTRIPGVSSGNIQHHFFQVTSHALLFHLHVKFFNFHGQNQFLGHSKIVASTHTEIRDSLDEISTQNGPPKEN